MDLFEHTAIDLAAERQRIDRPRTYNKRQRKALHKLVDLFEAGKWQKCLDHLNNPKSFPRNPQGEYSEKEHIGPAIGEVLSSLGYSTFYTVPQMRKALKKTPTSSL